MIKNACCRVLKLSLAAGFSLTCVQPVLAANVIATSYALPSSSGQVASLRLVDATKNQLTAQPVADQPAAKPTTQSVDTAQSSTSTNTTASATAAAPLTNAVSPSMQTNFDTPVSALTQEQRLARLEQQVTNLINLGQAQKITSLQEQVQALMGQLEVVQHDLKQLNHQQRGFYQDLDQRINHLQTLSSSTSGTSGASDAGATKPPAAHNTKPSN